MLEELIPAGLRSKIVQSPLFSAISVAADLIEAHFDLSGTPFFREYTDHSFRHSVEVFKTACDMISNDSLEIISSDDLNILVLGCMLHDSGLHLTEDMFIALTAQSNKVIAISAFDAKSWPELWTEFVAEAKRFSAKKLVSLFGDSEPVREPPRRPLDMTARDRLLIGEFLRRHHPRFAHEFAIGAVPDAKGGRFKFEILEPAAQDMAGLVARSHGVELRATFDYIQHRYDLRDYNRVHLIFLMTLLRISDYLQIQPARAPELFGKLHNIKSPFSLGEWRLHQSIENITTSSLDPDAILVAANPASVHEYLKFERWTKGLQRELDTSWAILGEVYGRFTREALDKLRLNIRRIRTNIEDKDTLQKRVAYVPDAISFTVAEAELLKLLIAPLYGDDPIYGLRELTQNSADSIREMRHLLTTGTRLTDNRLTQDADIELYVSINPNPHVVIADRGTGMTLDIVKEFFLRAGATFRNSDLWKRQFEDAAGASKITRAGRFGVGALSAFLLGDRIEVYTRHFGDQSGNGIRFSANIDEDEIEIVQERGGIGTRIKIISDQQRISRILKYFKSAKTIPYFFESADIGMSLLMDGEPLPEENNDANEEERQKVADALALESNWIVVAGTKYDLVRWDRTTHIWRDRWRGIRRESGYLFCNDILVGDLREPPKTLVVDGTKIELGDTFAIASPTITITDNNGRLPLDLARKAFARPDSELMDRVLESMWSEFLASFFYATTERPSEIAELWRNGDFHFQSEWVPMFFGATGYTFMDEMRLHGLAPETLVLLPYNQIVLERTLRDRLINERTFIIMRHAFWARSRTDVSTLLTEWSYRSTFPDFRHRHGRNTNFAKKYFVFDKELFEDALGLKRAPRYLRELLDSSHIIKVGARRGVVVSRHDLENSDVKSQIGEFVERIFINRPDEFEIALAGPMVFHTEYSNANPRSSHLSDVWNQSFESNVIPYDRGERRRIIKRDAPIVSFEPS